MADALSPTSAGHMAHHHGDYLEDPPGLRAG